MDASKLALSLWERERVRANFTLTPSPSPKGEGKKGAAQSHVPVQLSGQNIRLTHYRSFGGISDIACSATAAMVKLGLAPKLAGITEPSTTHNPG
jgi:hypothetical protein